jgi:hypothetical protein
MKMEKRAPRASPLVVLMVVAAPSLVHAQAWTPEAKTLSVDASYQLDYATHTENVYVTLTAHQLVTSVEYGITDHLAVSASLPFVAVKSEAGMYAHGPWDDSAYHSTVTDARLTARYMLPVSFLAITPQLGVSSPVREYPVLGSAAPGRGLKAAYIGLNVGADLDEYVPRTTLHAAYELAVVERFTGAGPEGEDIDQNYSNVSAQVGHSVADFNVSVGLDYRAWHDGIAFSDFGTSAVTMQERMNHDPIIKEKALLIGGGIGYGVGEHVSLSASARIFVTGENTHNASVFAAGVVWDFSL